MKSFLDNVKLVRVDGILDEEMTLEQFASLLSSLKAKEANDQEVISAAVAKFWTDNAGLKALNVDALTTNVCMKYLSDVPLDAIADVKESIAEYIRSQPGTFYIARGRSKDGASGVRLIARMTPDQVSEMKKAREESAKRAQAKAEEAAKLAATAQ